MNKNPHQHCTERFPGCQEVCERGKAWDAKERDRRIRIAEERKRDMEAIGCAIELKENVRKEKGRR